MQMGYQCACVLEEAGEESILLCEAKWESCKLTR